MNKHRDMLDYFDRSCFQKLFEAIEKKYRSLGRVGGAVKLSAFSPEDRERLSGFLGRDCRGDAVLSLKLQEVDDILQQSRFMITLEEFLPLYRGAELLSNKEAAFQESERWATFFARLQRPDNTAITGEWLAELAAGTGTGYRTALALYRHDEREAAALLGTCVKALDRLAQNSSPRRQRLPVFAAALTGDPHALDLDKPLGRLLFYALHHLYGLAETEYGAEKRKLLFSRAGLEEDDLSSNVIVAGLQVQPGDPREPIFTASAAIASPLLLPLRFLEQPTAWQPAAVYTLENPALFSAILDLAADRTSLPALVCTSGQPSVAALKLLDQLVERGSAIYYSGDFDPRGLEIGRRLQERYGISFQPWLFDTKAYLQAPKGVELTAEQIKKLAGQQVPWDSKLIETMLQVGKAVYQEVLVEQMIKNFV